MSSGRTGVLGGTFHPIHLGHIGAALAAADALGLDRVLLTPAGIPPHRPIQPHASIYHRFAMVALASLVDHRLRACDIELETPGPSFTSDTLKRLVEQGSAASQLFFITGADAFAEIATWRDYPDLLDRCRFVVVARPGLSASELVARLPGLASRMVELQAAPSGAPVEGAFAAATGQQPIFLLGARTPDVSSTELRRRIREGGPLDALVPGDIAKYIRQHGLYGAAVAAEPLHGKNRVAP